MDLGLGRLWDAPLLVGSSASQASVVDEDVVEPSGRMELTADATAVDRLRTLEQLGQYCEAAITELLLDLVLGSNQSWFGLAAVRLALERPVAAKGSDSGLCWCGSGT